MGTTEDKMVGWHHQLNRHKPKQTLGESGQGSLACYSPWGHKELSTKHNLATKQFCTSGVQA